MKTTFHQRNLYACQTIRNRLDTFERVRQSVIRRVQACIDSGGGCLEHLLWIVAGKHQELNSP
jgi:hypothetical protein